MEKTSENKRHQTFKLSNLCGKQLKNISAFVFVPSVFWEKIPTAEF